MQLNGAGEPLKKRGYMLHSGAERRKEGQNKVNGQEREQRKSNPFRLFANIAGSRSCQRQDIPVFAQINAKPHIGENKGWITKNVYVAFAEKSLR